MTLSALSPRWRPSEYMFEELLRYDAGVDMDLENIDLAGSDLAGINLTGVTMSGASLRGANLRGATLDRACLRDVDARFANLTAASLCEAFLIDTDLEGATVADIETIGSMCLPTRRLRTWLDQPGQTWMVGGLVRPEATTDHRTRNRRHNGFEIKTRLRP